jgi:anti-sigma factor RsiW
VTLRDPALLTCQEVVEHVTELLEGALPPEDRVRLEQHLLACPPCTLHLAQLKSSISLTGQLLRSAEPAPANASDVFRRWKSK